MKNYKLGIRTYATDFGLYGSIPLDWIVGEGIQKSDVVFIAETPINMERQKAFAEKGYDVVYLKQYPGILKESAWKYLLSRVWFDDYLTYNDFSPSHHIRNRVFREQGIRTWYYPHSSNQVDAYVSSRVPTVHDGLDIDNIFVWNNHMMSYFLSHAAYVGNVWLTGCLWSSLIDGERKRIIAVFDTTWKPPAPEADTSRIEGQFYAFVSDLVREFPNHTVIYKPKNTRVPQIPGVIFSHENQNISPLISQADFVISAPFTSPSLIALGAGRRGYWFCPEGFCPESYYHNYPNVLVSSVEDLRENLGKRQLVHPGIEPFHNGQGIWKAREAMQNVAGRSRE